MAGPEVDAATNTAGERIAKRIARAGVCSRRDAERLVAEGRVAVNGMPIASPALNVGPRDRITIDGAALPAADPVRLWRHHKLKSRITSTRDPQGRSTVFDDLDAEMPRVMAVGRLDFNTEGLLLLTNDGALARALELPATGWIRRYRARVHGPVDESALAALEGGVEIEGARYGPVNAVLERRIGTNAWLRIGLTEGKNREVRKLLSHLGLEVTRLIRVSFGPFHLGKLAPGATAEVPAKQLAEQLGGLLPKGAHLPAGPPEPTKPRHAHHRRTP